ncbi:hypothetical protein Tco_1489970, partial [Tanacetum coccineum]
MAPLPPREQRHPFLRYWGLEYTNADIADFEERLERIYSREIHWVHVVDFKGMSELMRDNLFARMVIEHHNDAGVVVFTSRAWGRLFDTRGPLFQLGGSRRRLSWRQFIMAMGLHIGEEMESLGFAWYWSESERMIPGKGDLHDYWRSISTHGDFLGPPPSYTLIRDPMLRLCHRMMTHNIAGRSQAPKKVTVTDLFYFRELDVGPICEQLDDTWAWVAMGPERQPDAAAGATGVAQDSPFIDEGGQADLAPVQAPPPPLAAA